MGPSFGVDTISAAKACCQMSKLRSGFLDFSNGDGLLQMASEDDSRNSEMVDASIPLVSYSKLTFGKSLDAFRTPWFRWFLGFFFKKSTGSQLVGCKSPASMQAKRPAPQPSAPAPAPLPALPAPPAASPKEPKTNQRRPGIPTRPRDFFGGGVLLGWCDVAF